MPVYEFFCRACQERFELLRPMRESEQAAACPSGHPGAMRTISVFAAVSKGERGESLPVGGGCACGGACSCGAH